jgi:hypothetical protein
VLNNINWLKLISLRVVALLMGDIKLEKCEEMLTAARVDTELYAFSVELAFGSKCYDKDI